MKQVSVVVAVTLWGTIYQELWEREEKLIAVKWGTAGFEEAEKDRWARRDVIGESLRVIH